LRDGGDLRASGWLIAGYRSPNPRVRAEATDAMKRVADRFSANRYRWAGDFAPATYRAYVLPYAEDARVLASGDAQGPREFATAILETLAQP
jgi:hypothetical protein